MRSLLLCSFLTIALISARVSLVHGAELVAEQESESEAKLTVVNNTSGTTSTVINVYGKKITANQRFPIRVVLTAGASKIAGSIFNTNPTEAAQFKIEADSQPGKLNAEHSPRTYYRLPFQDGQTYRISQAYDAKGESNTHNSLSSRFAVDFDMPIGSPVAAARSGIVVQVKFDSAIGGVADEYYSTANFVMIEHTDGTLGHYGHLMKSAPIVQVGQSVNEGQLIGYSGNTGYSSGPHLHFAVTRPIMNKFGKLEQESLPITFYVHNPAVLFKPRVSNIVTADYTTPYVASGSLK